MGNKIILQQCNLKGLASCELRVYVANMAVPEGVFGFDQITLCKGYSCCPYSVKLEVCNIVPVEVKNETITG